MVFKPFSVKVKNLQFAPTVISFLKIRLKLGIILHNLGNKWRMLFFLSIKRKKWDLDKSLLNNRKKYRKAKRCNYWALHPKATLDNISLDTEHSQDVTNNLVLIVFTCWKQKNYKISHEKCNERGKLDRGAILLLTPCIKHQ